MKRFPLLAALFCLIAAGPAGAQTWTLKSVDLSRLAGLTQLRTVTDPP